MKKKILEYFKQMSSSGYATPSPRGKKSVGGRTSRVIPDHTRDMAKKVEDLPFNLHGVELRHVQRATLSNVHTNPDAYIKALFGSAAIVVAAGGYGVTYKVLMTRRTRPILMKLAGYLTNTLYISTPALGTTALIKIAAMTPKVTSTASVAQFIKENSREAAAHIHLWRAPPVKIDGVCPIVVHAKKYVPRFYSFGIDMMHGMAVTIMEYIKNSIPLKKVARVSPAIFMELEKALGSFYVASVDHSDLHLDNILVHNGSQIKIIDYGFAVRLPDSIRKKFVRYYKTPASTASLNTAAQIYSMQYSNAIQYKRYNGRLSFYNPSYAALRVVWHAMSASNKAILKKHHDSVGHIIACSWK